MSQGLTIGVDFGSTGLRVAYPGDGGTPVVLPGSTGEPGPGISCARHSKSPLGVAFFALKSRLGQPGAPARGGSPAPAAEIVTRLFRSLKRGVEERTSSAVGEAVVTVPALYSASQRAALRSAVLAAGFAEAHLLNDSVAAVIAQAAARRDHSATVLVYAMGYAGFELGLVRVAHGHYRALAYEGGWSPAGWTFDQLLLESLLSFLEERRLRLDTAGWDLARWLAVRAIAQRVKEGLSTAELATFPLALQTPEGQPLGPISLGRAGFEEAIRPALHRTLDLAAGLLEQAGMTPAEVDTVLLVGGSTRIPALRALIAGALGREPIALDGEALARGAALFAAQLGSRPVAAGAMQEREDGGGGEVEPPVDLAPLRAALAVAEGPLPAAAGERLLLVAGAARSSPDDGRTLLAPAVRLAEQGRTAEARSWLEELIREAQGLLARIEAPPASAHGSTAAIIAGRILTRAQRLLKKGQHEEAVRESHLAWEQDRDNPDTFEKMIDIHCQAALAGDGAQSYANAQRWLGCAYSHDEGNTRVRGLIAESHFRHAKQLNEQGRRKQALETLEHCLAWNPEHDGARELHASLLRR